MHVEFDMQRWMLNLLGAALLATPVLLTLPGVSRVLGTTGWSGATDGIPGWLNLSIAAGAYLIKWSPALLGAAIIFYANQRRD